MIYLQQDVRLAASRFLSSIADQNFGVEGGWRAIQQRMRSELSLSNFVFTGSGERDIHPTPQHTNLAAAHTSRHQNSLCSHTLLQTLTYAPIICPCHRSRSTRDLIKVKPQMASQLRIGDSHHYHR